MGLKDWLEARSALKALDRLATAMEKQTDLLARLADRFAPEVQPAKQSDLVPLGGLYTRDSEQARILQFMDETRQTIGRDPSEEEIVRYLDGESA